MLVIVSKQEQEILTRLRGLGELGDVPTLSSKVLSLQKQIAELDIEKGKRDEQHAREERELRHMIGLEKKRQEVEIAQAKRETELSVREGNLKAEKERFSEQLKFNTQRFETMETYLKEMMADILKRLPNVNVEVKRSR